MGSIAAPWWWKLARTRERRPGIAGSAAGDTSKEWWKLREFGGSFYRHRSLVGRVALAHDLHDFRNVFIILFLFHLN
jgi:hypothetical protein